MSKLLEDCPDTLIITPGVSTSLNLKERITVHELFEDSTTLEKIWQAIWDINRRIDTILDERKMNSPKRKKCKRK